MQYRDLIKFLRPHAVQSESIPVGVILKLTNGATICIAAGSVYATDSRGAPIEAVNGALATLNMSEVRREVLKQ